MNDFDSRSVAYGLKRGAFDHLSDRDKKRLLRVMWRISEKSYRRGLQHGMQAEPTVDPYEYRYERNLDKAPGCDGWGGTSAFERLVIEYRELNEIGFREIISEKEYG